MFHGGGNIQYVTTTAMARNQSQATTATTSTVVKGRVADPASAKALGAGEREVDSMVKA